MAASLQEMLSVRVTTKVVKQVAGVNRYLLQRFGMQPGGFAEKIQGHRNFGYDVFNDTRNVSQARAPGAPSATVTRQKVGRVEGTFPRFREHLPLLAEEVHNYRAIGGSNAVFDERGRTYITKQQSYMGQRVGNNRTLLLAGMLRGGALYAHGSGDDIYYDFTSGTDLWAIDWKMPSGNKNQLNMLGGGSLITATWATETTDIPAHLMTINAAFNQLSSTNLQLAICGNKVWNAVTRNDVVASLAGTSNPPFSVFRREIGTDPGTGMPQTVMIGYITAIPWLEWIITDEGFTIGAPGSESFVKFIPDDYVWFGPSPNRDLFEMLLGDEPVNEGPNMPITTKAGVFSYNEVTTDPPGWKLHTGDNCIPANYVPNASAYARVIGF